MSGVWAVFKARFERFARFFQKKKRPDRSNLTGKPLKSFKSWAVYERDLYPGGEPKVQKLQEDEKLKQWATERSGHASGYHEFYLMGSTGVFTETEKLFLNSGSKEGRSKDVKVGKALPTP